MLEAVGRLGVDLAPSRRRRSGARTAWGRAAALVHDALPARGARDTRWLALESGVPPDAIRAALIELERRGLARCRDGLWQLAGPGGGDEGVRRRGGCCERSDGRRRGRFVRRRVGYRRIVASTLPDVTRPHDPPAHRRYEPRPPAMLPVTPAAVAAQLGGMLRAGELDLPRREPGTPPGGGRRWPDWGGRDLSLARLAEGHVDALAILAEAGRAPAPGALYGVWASRSGGAAVRLERRGSSRVLAGTMRFCSGARVLDRALVVADPPGEAPSDGRLLLDVDVTVAGVEARRRHLVHRRDGGRRHPGRRVRRRPGHRRRTWSASPAGTSTAPASRSVARGSRPSGGEAPPACSSGCSGICARPRMRTSWHTSASCTPLLAAADALLRQTAAVVDADPAGDHGLAVATVRAAVERAAREVVDRAPRIVGPAPLSRDADLARALADLALYVRQHHAERDHAALGGQVVDRWRTA